MQNEQQDPTPRRTRLIPWAIVALLALAMAILLVPIPRMTPIDRELGNLAHAPCFAILAAICYSAWRHFLPRRPLAGGLAVWLAVSFVGLLTEWLQGFTARSPSFQDLAANIAGAAAGVLWLQSRAVQRPAARYALAATAVGLIVTPSVHVSLAIYEHYQQWRAFPMLASFERPRELQHWTLRDCHADRTRLLASDGAWSLRLVMTPTRWAGAALRPAADWSDYEELVFDVWLAETRGNSAEAERTLTLMVKVADADHNGEPDDRFHQSVQLAAGHRQTVRIRLAEVRAAPAGREMDLSRIHMLQFFILRQQQPRTIWLDNIHLE